MPSLTLPFSSLPQADNITALVKAAGVEVEPYWPALFANLAAKKSIEDFILNVGAGGGGAAAASGGGDAGAAAGGGAAAAKEEEKVEEEEDADMGFSLFD
jgi:large subunit ribosomal protein LP1